jgi:MFS family permease
MAYFKISVNPFWILTLSVFMAMIGLGIISPIIPNFASELGATGLTIGLIYSGFSISRTILQTPMGRLSDKTGKKKIINLGLIAYAITSVLYTYARTPEMLIAIRMFHGVGSAMVMPVAMAYAMDLTPEGKEGRYMGYLNTAIFLGYGTGPLLGGLLYERYSTSTAFYGMSALIIISLILTVILVPDDQSIKSNSPKPRVSLRKILTNRKLTGSFVYRMINALGRGTIMVFLPLYAIQLLGISGTLVGLILSIGVFTTGLFQTPMGTLADRYNKTILLVTGGLISSAGYFYMTQTTTTLQLFIARIIISMGGALSIPALTAIVAEEGKKLGTGSTMGVYATSMSLGQIIGPTLTGILFDRYGMDAVFNFTGIIGIISVASFYLLGTGKAKTESKLLVRTP